MVERIRFDRNEFAGSFGDIGTDLPLIVGILLTTGIDGASVFITFGLLQIATGLFYGLPMPMQPLKAMAVLVITQKIGGPVLYGAGIAIGVTMLLLSVSGLLTLLARAIPLSVVRGVQFGLGLKLASLALGRYVPAMGGTGYALAAGAVFVMLLLWENRRLPAGLVVIAAGALWALLFDVHLPAVAAGVALALPRFHVPGAGDIATGFLVLALPQLPLSISNSVIATDRTVDDLFPGRRPGVRKIGLTYSLANLVAPLAGGIPVCHGCGGLAGHYVFGARTGGSVVLYGAFYLVIGLFLSGPVHEVLKVFPLPILGVVLLFEALVLLAFIGDQAAVRRNLLIALFVGVLALTLPHGFLVALLAGTIVHYLFPRFGSPEGISGREPPKKGGL